MSVRKKTPVGKHEYSVHGRVVGGKHVGEVWADTAAEALVKARELEGAEHVSFCHQCTDECEDPQVDKLTVERRLDDGTFETAEDDDDFTEGDALRSKLDAIRAMPGYQDARGVMALNAQVTAFPYCRDALRAVLALLEGGDDACEG